MKDINLEFYKVFCKVAEKGSFSKAAEDLYISQPAITQTIKKLEDELGGKLFYRNNNGVVLTEEGKHFFNYIIDSMNIINNASDKFDQYKNLGEGIIKIRTGSNNARRILYKPLIEFGKDYPNIRIQISAGSPQDSMRLLATRKIDIVILDSKYNDNKYKNVIFTDIVENDYIFVVSPKYTKDNKVEVNKILDLNNYSLILPKEETAARNILNEYTNNEILNYRYEMISEEMRKDFALEGLGIAYVMRNLVKDELKEGKLIEIRLPMKYVESKIGMAVLNDEISSFATKKLTEYIKRENI